MDRRQRGVHAPGVMLASGRGLRGVESVCPAGLHLHPVTFPLLLVALSLVTLMLALAIGGWTGHARPAPAEAQRVTDAVERAGLSQVIPGLAGVGGIVVFLTIAGGGYAMIAQRPLLWFLLAPALSGVVVHAACYYSSRRMVRAAGQLVGAISTDEAVSISARSTLAASLVCDGAAGLLVVGLWAAAQPTLGAEAAEHLCLLAALSTVLISVLLARSASVAAGAAHYGSRVGAVGQVHPASLAELVSSSFGYSIVRCASLLSVSAFGRAILLLLSRGEASDSAHWIYPHLLQALGTLAIVFGLMTVRSSEREPGTWGWLRGATVTLVLLIAGAWSLSRGLAPGIASRAIPSAATFFFLGTGVAVWLGTGGRSDQGWGAALRKLPSAGVLFTITAILLVSIPETLTAQKMEASEIRALILTSVLSAVPVAFAWHLGDGLFRSARGCSLLASEGKLPIDEKRSAIDGPGRGLLGILPALWCLVCFIALSRVLPVEWHFDPLLFGAAAGLGACMALAGAGLNLRSSRSAGRSIRELVLTHARATASEGPNLTKALTTATQAGWTLAFVWPTLLMSPALIIGIAAWAAPPGAATAVAVGLAIGGVVTGLGLNLALDHPAAEELQTEGALVSPTVVSHAAWAVTLVVILSSL